MRVLFICGHGKIDVAVASLKKRLQGSVDLDTLGNLSELDSYFAKGQTFDKCVVLSPDRIIPDYTPDILDSEMLKFKRIVNTRCSAVKTDIILCVSNDSDGSHLAELFSDMLGEVTILKVGAQLKVPDFQDLIVQQGFTLAKKFQSYDLTFIAKTAAKERMTANKPNSDYQDLSDLVLAQQQEEAPEEILTPLGGMDNAGSDSDEAFNPDGFSEDVYESEITDDFFENDSSSNSNFFGGSVDSNDNRPNGFFDDVDDNSSKKLSEDNEENVDAVDDSIPDDIDSEMFGGIDNNDIDDSAFSFGDADNNSMSNGSFGGFGGNDSDININSDISFGNDDIEEDKPDTLDEMSEPEPEVHQETEHKSKGLSMLSNKNNAGSKLGKTKPAAQATLKKEKVEKEPAKKEKEDKKSLFGFGKNKKQDTPKNINTQDDEYELAQGKFNNTGNMQNDDSEMMDDFSSDNSPVIEEVSTKKGIGLAGISKRSTPQEKKPALQRQAAKKPVLKKETPAVSSDVDMGEMYDMDETNNYESNMSTNESNLEVDAESLYDIDTSAKRTVEKGQGKGLNTTDLNATNIKRVGKQSNKGLDEVLKPFYKRGGLFVVTGSHATGKTIISANIANLLCRHGLRVCVLDLDFQGKGQSYLNLDTFRIVHGGYQTKMNSLHVVNSTGTEFAKWTDVIRSGYHVITTTLNSDVEETHNLVKNTNMTRLIRQLTSAYNVVVVDVDFHDLVTYFKDFVDASDLILSIEEATQRGLTNFMLNMANIEDEDVRTLMFNRLSLVLNKEDGMKSLFGRKVNRTNDILVTLDDTIAGLLNHVVEYTFTDIPVVSILKYSNVYEKFWYTNKYITDTKDGEKIFSELLQNALSD
jgi:cellulose biosynthesis protein BcsQ